MQQADSMLQITFHRSDDRSTLHENNKNWFVIASHEYTYLLSNHVEDTQSYLLKFVLEAIIWTFLSRTLQKEGEDKFVLIWLIYKSNEVIFRSCFFHCTYCHLLDYRWKGEYWSRGRCLQLIYKKIQEFCNKFLIII